jgi:hypothetical protein
MRRRQMAAIEQTERSSHAKKTIGVLKSVGVVEALDTLNVEVAMRFAPTSMPSADHLASQMDMCTVTAAQDTTPMRRCTAIARSNGTPKTASQRPPRTTGSMAKLNARVARWPEARAAVCSSGKASLYLIGSETAIL